MPTRSRRNSDGTPSSGVADDELIALCDLDGMSFLTSDRQRAWALRDESGIQAMRVPGGPRQRDRHQRRRRSATGACSTAITARLFVAATADAARRRRALPLGRRPPVAARAALAVRRAGRGARARRSSRSCCGAAASASARSRAPPMTRAALAGRADSRHGTVRAAPRRRRLAARGVRARARRSGACAGFRGYARLSAERTRRGARHGSPASIATTLAAAIHHRAARRSHELRNTIALLEAARRRTLIEQTRSSHGTH